MADPKLTPFSDKIFAKAFVSTKSVGGLVLVICYLHTHAVTKTQCHKDDTTHGYTTAYICHIVSLENKITQQTQDQ